MGFYVRTGSGGTGPAIFLRDLGITIPTRPEWTSLGNVGCNGGDGPYTPEKLRDSTDLYYSIRSEELEATIDEVHIMTANTYTYAVLDSINIGIDRELAIAFSIAL